MGTPYFNRDESIILTAHKVKFDSALSDVMLTNQRLILIDAGYAQFRPQTIPLTSVETVIPGEDAYGNPNITLSLAAITPGSATRTKELVFSQQTGSERKQECNDWVKRLKEEVISIRLKESPINPAGEDTDIIFDDTFAPGTEPARGDSLQPASPAPQEPVMIPPQGNTGTGETATDNTAPEEAVPGGSGEGAADEPSSITQLPPPIHPSDAPTGRSNFITVAAITIVILAVAGGLFIYSDSLKGNPPVSPGIVTTVPITPGATTSATPVQTTVVPEQTPTPLVTPLPTTLPAVVIPDTGVWVRVRYEGNYVGQVGVSGGMRQVSGSGDQLYQVPTIDGMIDVTIGKQDGSGNILAVEVYKNGMLVKRSTVATPRGNIDIHVDLKTV